MALITKTDHGYNQKYIRPLFWRPFDFAGWRSGIIATKIKTDELYQRLKQFFLVARSSEKKSTGILFRKLF